MQRREATSQRHASLVCAQSRSLKAARYGFAPLRLCGKLLLLAISLTAALFTGSHVASAQTPEDTVRVRTRVVFLDALVKDKRTGIPISDLKLENFQVYDDGSRVRFLTSPAKGKRASPWRSW